MNSHVTSGGRRLAPAIALGFALAWLASTSLAQTATRSEIRDGGSMFGADAIAKANALIARYEDKESIPIFIETMETAGKQLIDDVALEHARKSGRHGIYVVAARREHKLEVLVSEAFKGRIPDSKRLAIRGAFVDGFKEGNFDAGLLRGVRAIGQALGVAERGEAAPLSETSLTRSLPAEREEPTGGTGGVSSPLVLREQVRLTLGGAHRILIGAQKKAAEMGLRMNIAVVDDGGHPIAFARMDGARPASAYTASTKAVTAATFRANTGPVPAGATAPDPLLNLSLQNAALAGGGKLTTLLGGIPVIVDDQVIGGVGVGGGSGEQDATVARAGVDALLAELKANEKRPADETK
jgi:glc operon protein GlcG